MAERHFVNGGVNLFWTTAGNWSLTEGGAGGQAVPTNAEDVFFDVGSPDCTINSGDRYAKTLTTSAYTNTLTFSYKISVSGNITIGAGTQWAGTAALVMLVAGTLTTNGNTIGVPFTIGNFTAGTVTLADDLTVSGLLSFINATSTDMAGDYHIYAGSCTIDGTQTLTIIHAVTISGLTTIASVNVINGVFSWSTAGITSTGSLTGTTPIVLTGGTWTGAAGRISNPVTFAGDSIVSGTVIYGSAATSVLTYSSGSITTTSSTLSLGAGAVLDTAGISWNNITITLASTITINSLLTVTGTLTLPTLAITFDGTAGFTVGTLTHSTATATRIFTFEEGVTYTITSAITAAMPANSVWRYTYTSAHAATKAIITLDYGATQDIANMDPTRIDSSLGQCIFSLDGVITTSFNWSNTIANGNLLYTAGGESVTVAGITKDNAGVALGSCDVYLFRDNGGDTATYIAYVESGAADGTYSFTVFPGSTYFVVAFKGGATPVMDVTDRTVTAV